MTKITINKNLRLWKLINIKKKNPKQKGIWRDIIDRIRVFARNIFYHDSGFIPLYPNRQHRITTFLLRITLETLFIWVRLNPSVLQKVKTFALTLFFSLPSPSVGLHSRPIRTVTVHRSATYESLEHLLLHKSFCATRYGFSHNHFVVLLLVHCMVIHRAKVPFYSMNTRWFQRGGYGAIVRGNGRWWKCCGGVIIVVVGVKFPRGEWGNSVVVVVVAVRSERGSGKIGEWKGLFLVLNLEGVIMGWVKFRCFWIQRNHGCRRVFDDGKSHEEEEEKRW